MAVALYEIRRILDLSAAYRQAKLPQYLPVLRDDLWGAIFHLITIVIAGAVAIDAIFFSTRPIAYPPNFPTFADNFLVCGLIAYLAIPQILALVRIRQQRKREIVLTNYLREIRHRARATDELLKPKVDPAA